MAAAAPQRHGNSIFIFEVANLCIAHLGHLHHTLNQQQLNEIGRVDVVLVPVDGGATLDLEGMIEVLTALKAPLMIPMHYFSSYTLERFLERVAKDWDVETRRSAVGRGFEDTRCRQSRRCWCCRAGSFSRHARHCERSDAIQTECGIARCVGRCAPRNDDGAI